MSYEFPTNEELRLYLGEMTEDECGIAWAAYRLGWKKRREQDNRGDTEMADGGFERTNVPDGWIVRKKRGGIHGLYILIDPSGKEHWWESDSGVRFLDDLLRGAE